MAGKIVLDAAAPREDLFSLLSDTLRARDTLLVFDFDGVLASNREEQVYQAAPEPDERPFLDDLAQRLAIDPNLYDTRYLRHLIFQQLQLELGEEIESGPLLPLARQMGAQGLSYYILTARSSPSAIVRTLAFCEKHELRPQEIFFVGRVGKGRQLRLIGSGHEGRRIVYFEDSLRHVRNSTALAHDLLTTVHVVWDKENGLVGRRTFLQTVNKYFLSSRGEGR